MRRDLFRQQVLDAKNAVSAQFGRPSATVPPAWSWFIGGLIVFFSALLCFVIFVDFARKETVRGHLRYTTAEARIVVDRAGVVDKVFIEDGHSVKAGQPLLRVKSERYLSDGTTLNELTQIQLYKEIDALNDRKETAETAAAINRLGLEQRQRSLADAVKRNRTRLNLLAGRLNEAGERLEEARSFFEEGLITKANVDLRQSAYETIETELASLQRQMANDQSDLDNIAVEYRQIEARLDEEGAINRQELSRLEGQISDVSSNTAYQLVSSIDGTVTALQVREGETVDSGRLTMAVVPENSELFAELYLPSRAIAFIRPGQTVKLQYDALPYQKFGVSIGVVSSVANTALLSADLGINSQSDELLYRIEVDLKEQSLMAFGQPIPLQSGMELSADIVLEDRRIFEWLFSAFRSAG